MTAVLGIRFSRCGRLYYVSPGDHAIAVGDSVLVPTESGPVVGTCVWAADDVEWSGSLPTCLGRAEVADLARAAAHRQRCAELMRTAKTVIASHGLPMAVIGVDSVEQAASEPLAVIYFTAPGRIDFRSLVGDLARALGVRVDLRQIGSRDAAAVIGGVSVCGRELCCAAMKPATQPVAIRLARLQDLPANPAQVSGACGRPMCCLAYEAPLYAAFLDVAPAIGAHVDTPDGEAVVTGHAVPADSVHVKGLGGQACYPLSQIRVRPTPRPVRPGPRWSAEVAEQRRDASDRSVP